MKFWVSNSVPSHCQYLTALFSTGGYEHPCSPGVATLSVLLRKSLKMKRTEGKVSTGKGLKPAETRAATGPAGGWGMEHVDLPCPRLLIGLGTSVQLFGQSPWLCIGCLAVEL